MGHTAWSQRIASDLMISELRAYAKAMREQDRIIVEQLLSRPLLHYGAISYANSIHAWAFLLLSIHLEQEKRIKKIEELYERLADGRLPGRKLASHLD